MRSPRFVHAGGQAVVVVAASLLCACQGSVSGKVDGADVPPLLSAFFIHLDEADGQFNVATTLTTTFGGCDGATRRQEKVNELTEALHKDIDGETDPDKIDNAREDCSVELLAFVKATEPTDRWTIQATVNAADDGDINGETFSIADGEVSVSVCRQNDIGEVDNNAIQADVDCFTAIKGKVRMDSFVKASEVKLAGQVTLVEADDVADEDPDTVGDFGFATTSASYCPALEKAVDDAAELQAKNPLVCGS